MPDTNNVRVLDRAIAIMSLLSSANEPLGLSDIARDVELSKATSYRILATLADHDLVVKNANGSYQTGPRVLKWSASFRRGSALIEIARPYMKTLNEGTSETIHLFSYEKGKAFYIDKMESTQQVRLQAVVGGSPLLYSTSAGRAILSRLPDDEFEIYLANTELQARTPHTCTNPDVFRKLIAEAKFLGYAEEDEQNEEGIRCVGAAIVRHDGYPIGALSVTAPKYRVDDIAAAAFGEQVRGAAQQISARFGCAQYM